MVHRTPHSGVIHRGRGWSAGPPTLAARGLPDRPGGKEMLSRRQHLHPVEEIPGDRQPVLLAGAGTAATDALQEAEVEQGGADRPDGLDRALDVDRDRGVAG
ncbi:hypothetical protein GCM10009557_06110 [Virgisporangium ochraceum]